MTAPIAQLKTGEIFDEIQREYGWAPTYIARDLRYAAISKKVAAVQKVAPGEGLFLRAHLDSLLGDLQAVRDDVSNLVRSPHTDSDLFNASAALCRIGLYKEAQSLLKPAVTAESGSLSRRRDRAYAVGLFQHTADQFARAREMSLELVEGGESTHGREAAQILAEGGISDETVATHMDIAGMVLRDHRYICHINTLNTAVSPDGLPVVVLQMLLRAPADVLFTMNVEMVEKIESLGHQICDRLVVAFSELPARHQ